MDGFINNILNIYFHQHFPRAISVAETMRATSTKRFIYTTHPWLVSLYLNCPINMTLSAIPLICPSPAEVASFRAAVAAGDITWHRGPFNMQPENLASSSLFELSLDLALSLSQQFGLPASAILSQRDVPGMTRGSIPLLAGNGVSAITVGVNDYTCAPDVPKAFVWKDIPSGTDVIALFHAYGCTFPTSSPIPVGAVHASPFSFASMQTQTIPAPIAPNLSVSRAPIASLWTACPRRFASFSEPIILAHPSTSTRFSTTMRSCRPCFLQRKSSRVLWTRSCKCFCP
jgi:hypothetical protein